METEHSGDNIEVEHSGDHPEAEHLKNITEMDYAEDHAKTETSKDNDDNDLNEDMDRQIKVMEGDNVTLHSGSMIIKHDDHIIWSCGHSNTSIAITGNRVYFNNVERFGGRLHVDPQTGSFTINDIRTTDSGLYYQHAFNMLSQAPPRIYNVTVFGECLNMFFKYEVIQLKCLTIEIVFFSSKNACPCLE